MKIAALRVGLVSGLIAVSALSAQAVGVWDGTWCTSDVPESRIELIVKEDLALTLVVGGKPMAVTENELSPDRKTMIFRWDGGEGTLTGSPTTEAALTIFDKRIPTRGKSVTRK